MSFETFRRMQDHYANEDLLDDRYDRSQTQKRAVVLTGQELEDAATKLYENVITSFSSARRASPGNTVSIDLKETLPECVVKKVIDMLATKGVKAKHSFNELHPTYDLLVVENETINVTENFFAAERKKRK